MVGNLGVVHDALAYRELLSSEELLRERRQVGERPRGLDPLLEAAHHVPGEVAAGGARVGDQLSLLVERLGGTQGTFGRETVAGVGVALELGQIVEERRLLSCRLLLRFADGPRPAAHFLLDPVRGLSLGHAVLLILEPDAVVSTPVTREAGVDGPELLGLEVLYLLFTVDEKLQGRGLYAAHREYVSTASEADRVGAGGIHADDPVSLSPAAGCVFERFHRSALAQIVETLPYSLVGEGGDPEPENRLAATRETVQVGEDELSLSPRVAGVYNLLYRRAPHQPLYHVELFAGLVVHPDLEASWQDRQALQTPLLVLLAVSVWRCQLRQVPERPGNGPAFAGQSTLLPSMPPQDTRYVPADGRLLGDDEPHTKEYTYGRDDSQMRLSGTQNVAEVLGLLLGQ